MPITPFHFGPGAALQAGAPRHVSFLAFFSANVLIDLESFINFTYGFEPVHAFFHTYVGASIVVAFIALAFVGLRALAARVRLPNLFDWQALSMKQVLIGAALGAWSHIAIDSFMHFDMQPFSPFAPGNPFAGKVSVEALEYACVAAGVMGLVVAAARWAFARK
ncbi:hypothetical protein [Diaphorobacter caeni]|uniref:hypothetical protein n=1 Tax=Diaphorobacter caeni TaxID=2784387 RepID=UPI001890A5A6|nr:hypothetical protein [Diaphorobacter caeni]MBF5002934.1 hypothetical protein [Diaphorobacter caeni]